jgi:hypothetical protein
VASVARFLGHQALRLEARWSHWSLDERLAAGFDPASDQALAVRAEQLCSARHRRRLAAWLERLARDAEVDGRRGMSSAVPIVCEQVMVARDSLLELAKLLRERERVRPRGVAIVERLLTDSGSDLYTKTARGAVEIQLQAALMALVGKRDWGAQAFAQVSGERATPAATLPL